MLTFISRLEDALKAYNEAVKAAVSPAEAASATKNAMVAHADMAACTEESLRRSEEVGTRSGNADVPVSLDSFAQRALRVILPRTALVRLTCALSRSSLKLNRSETAEAASNEAIFDRHQQRPSRLRRSGSTSSWPRCAQRRWKR